MAMSSFENRGLDEVALFAPALATAHEAGAVLLTGLHVAQDLVELRAIDLRPVLRG
jgi:hypothetical protein